MGNRKCSRNPKHGPAAPGRKLCRNCIDVRARRKQALSREGLCQRGPTHGAPAPGKKFCQTCLDGERERRRIKRDDRIRRGVCSRGGRAHGAPASGKNVCQSCYDRSEEQRRRRRRALNKEGLCQLSRSHGPVAPGKKFCQPCLDRWASSTGHHGVDYWNRASSSPGLVYILLDEARGLVKIGTTNRCWRKHKREFSRFNPWLTIEALAHGSANEGGGPAQEASPRSSVGKQGMVPPIPRRRGHDPGNEGAAGVLDLPIMTITDIHSEILLNLDAAALDSLAIHAREPLDDQITHVRGLLDEAERCAEHGFPSTAAYNLDKIAAVLLAAADYREFQGRSQE